MFFFFFLFSTRIRMRVVATLTTRPKYHDNFPEVLDSLVDQFDAVYLALPKVSRKGDVPYPLFSYPGVTIVPLETDHGPICKYMGALKMETDPNTLVVALDDDYVYSSTLRRFIASDHTDQAVAKSPSGIVFKYPEMGYAGFTGRWHSGGPYQGSSFSTLAAYCGLSFYRGAVNIDDLIALILECKDNIDVVKNDDVLFSAYLAQNGIPRKRSYNTKPVVKHIELSEALGADAFSYTGIFRSAPRAYLALSDCFEDEQPPPCLVLFDWCMIILAIIVVAVAVPLSIAAARR